MSWPWLLFTLYYLIMIIIYEYFLIKLKPILYGDAKLHSKYDAFDRTDKRWFNNRLLMYPVLWTFLPKFILVCIGLVGMGIACFILSIGLP